MGAYRLVLLKIWVLLIAASTASDIVDSCSMSHDITDQDPKLLYRIRILGLLKCSSNSEICPPLAGAKVIFSCDGGKIALADTMTETDGFYEIVVDIEKSINPHNLSDNDCRIVVGLPVARCEVFPSAGTLEAPLSPRGTYPDEFLGLVANYEAGPLHYNPPY
ncbi:hypothetical protein TorRG33x02_144610 [Trema orientale]|uniref:Pollen Ole e 1 allergen and extensin family protein n=1 Tax=Trema orientale TaxID=63057 RepID=A0A2P5EW66_TREOI|nr:hypothetical protein TorRG33x02_144610 [Trema orientale]